MLSRFTALAVLGLFAAASSDVLANVVGGDLQNFNALPGGVDFVTVNSSETLEPRYLNLSVMPNYAVNSLPYFEEGGSRTNYNDSLTMVDIGFGYGVAPNLEFGLAAQDLIDQNTDDVAGAHGKFNSRGVINWRMYGKYRILGDADHGIGVVANAVFNRVENNPYVGKDGSPIGILELVADTTVREIAMAVNVGYRFRKRGDPIEGMQLQPIGNQWIASAAMSYLLPRLDTKLIVEVFGARPVSRDDTGLERRQASSAELLGGVKHDLTSSLALHAGAGTELINGASSPDWRIYGGVNWAIGPIPRAAKEKKKHLKQVAPKEERAVFDVNFATGSDKVPVEAVPELESLSKEIQAGSYVEIVVEGHTDSVGSEELNLDLSQRRAETVRKWLMENAKVPEKKIKAVGFGETRPIADNGNFQGRAKNRRVEVVVRR